VILADRSQTGSNDTVGLDIVRGLVLMARTGTMVLVLFSWLHVHFHLKPSSGFGKSASV
jgi:hypothetical protein